MLPPRLSVILPTHNRAGSLRRALEALLRQSADPLAYEVIVVNSNSTDGTSELIASIDDGRIRGVLETRAGMSCARNAGLAAAAGEIVALTEDSVEAAPDWVETIMSALDARPSIQGVGGRVLPCWEGGRPHWLTRAHWAPLALQDHGDQKRIFDRTTPIGMVGANVAFRRAVFDRIGPFSPDGQRTRNGIRSTKDQDLLTRLYENGGSMLYLPRMLVMARVQPERTRRAYGLSQGFVQTRLA